MRIAPRRVVVTAVLVLASAVPAFAKRQLERVVISGPSLSEPLEVTDQEVLRVSNPWHGRFIEPSTAITAAPEGRSVYDVTLHARLRTSELRPIYQFRYAPGQSGERGLVYLPGRGEPWYRQNVSIILRADLDGGWHPADPEWERQVRRALGW